MIETGLIVGLSLIILVLLYEIENLERSLKQKDDEARRYKWERDIAMRDRG